MPVRQLRPYEAFLSTMSVSLFIEVTGPVTPDAIRSAYRVAAREHPSLRMAVAPREAGGLEFVDRAELEVPLESEAVADLGDFDWEDRLHQVANAARDHTASPVYMEHVGEKSDRGGGPGGRHFLFAVMNHAAMDGPGIFNVFNAFCRKLGAIVSGTEFEEAKPREFMDIIGRAREVPGDYEHPEIPDSLMPKLYHEVPDGCEDDQAIRCVFKEMDEDATERLVQNCRSHNCTIQGALSASSMVPVAKVQQGRHPLPQTLGVLAPINMRSQVEPPLDAGDCVCGSAGLWWAQSLASDQELFQVAEIATRSLRERKDEGYPTAWWQSIQSAKGWTPPVTVMSTSIGINPIQTRYGELGVERVHMRGGNYGAQGPREVTGTMAHVHTFGGRLCLTFSYSWPATSDKTGRELADTQWDCLLAMAAAGPEEPTVASMMN